MARHKTSPIHGYTATFHSSEVGKYHSISSAVDKFFKSTRSGKDADGKETVRYFAFESTASTKSGKTVTVPVEVYRAGKPTMEKFIANQLGKNEVIRITHEKYEPVYGVSGYLKPPKKED